MAIVDSPPDFESSGTVANASGWAPGVAPAFLNVSDGEVAGVFSLDRWVLRGQRLVWDWGPGSVPKCPALTADDLSRTTSQTGQPQEKPTELLPPGSLSDVTVPHMFNMSARNGTSYESLYFIANYSDGYSGLSFSSITTSFQLSGTGGTTSWFMSESGATFFVTIPFVSPVGKDLPYATWLMGVESTEYTVHAPWYGCVQWSGGVPNLFGTGLAFGPPPATGVTCRYP